MSPRRQRIRHNRRVYSASGSPLRAMDRVGDAPDKSAEAETESSALATGPRLILHSENRAQARRMDRDA